MNDVPAAAPPVPVFFARPGTLPPAGLLAGRVVVMDLAFDSRDPGRDIAWARSLGPRLAAWIDHHDQDCWAELAGDPRFVLVPRAVAPACPPLVTAERVARFGPAGSLLAHGDLDGVLSAAKWTILQHGLPVPAWIDPDGIAADTRQGVMSPRGTRLDQALRAKLRSDRVRRAIVASAWAEARGAAEPPALKELLDRAAQAHQVLAAHSRRIAQRAVALSDLPENVALLDLHACAAGVNLDLTEALLDLHRRYDWTVVLARGRGGRLKIVAGTPSERTGLDLRREFAVQGYAPFRVHLTPEQLLARLPSPLLRSRLKSQAI